MKYLEKSPKLREHELNIGTTKAGLAKICFCDGSMPWFVACCSGSVFKASIFSRCREGWLLSPLEGTGRAQSFRGGHCSLPDAVSVALPSHKLGPRLETGNILLSG